ncbi:hypothetical protein [Patulibacter defluvii]|uniref:hypothetical protein n=1 Tax=Patulibacter defluvii TaxID=3095358 RepID=UPI002A75E431|nr:hypothetical protein [Patulibacter sp. DM4]
MRVPPTALLPLAATGALLLPAAASAADVPFAPGEGTYVTDGRVACIVGVQDDGEGTVTCAGPNVYRQLWSGTRCQSWTLRGCVGERGLLSVGLGDRGRSRRDVIDGVGGAKDLARGDSAQLGRIRAYHLRDGGFSFRNRSGHGFTLTANRLRRF